MSSRAGEQRPAPGEPARGPFVPEDDLVVSRAQLSRLLAYVDEAIVAVDLEGRISFASPSLDTIAGYDPQQLLGRPMAEFIHPDDLGIAARLSRRGDPGRAPGRCSRCG